MLKTNPEGSLNPQGLLIIITIMGNKRPLFEPDTVYHVYNHGNAEDNIFQEDENYRFFLKRYAHYINPVARTYAFCLMPNHFHLMVKIRSYRDLADVFGVKDPQGFENPEGLHTQLSNRISHQFGTLLNSYTKAYNNYYDRQGSLFRNTTKRKPVHDDTYYTRLLWYIHQNPVLHGFVSQPSEWPYSSFQIILSRKTTQLDREVVLDWFESKIAFLEFHNQIQEIDKDEFY